MCSSRPSELQDDLRGADAIDELGATRAAFLESIGRLCRMYWDEANAIRACEVILRTSGGDPGWIGDYSPPRYGLFGITTAAAKIGSSDGWLLWNPVRNTAYARKLWGAYGWNWWGFSLPQNIARTKGQGGK